MESSIGLPGPDEGLRSQGRLVVRSPAQLHLHPALVRLNLASSLVGTSGASGMERQSVAEPILITTNDTIISGFRDWQSALSTTRPSIECIEYSFSNEDALQFILIRNRRQRFWNSFSRIRLALELEPYFQAKAGANQSHGANTKVRQICPKLGT